MKRKGIFVLVGLVVCALAFSAPLSGASADTDAFTLEIYGNANEDDTIDMRDYTYAARIICWLEEETDLADANYDGRISVADMTQIGLIILGRESELTIIDEADRTVTINIPIERVITTWRGQLETLRSIGAADKVVGVESYAVECTKDFFPEFSDVTTVGTVWEPDIELILSLHPDIVILFPGEGYGATNLDIAQDKLETSGLTVLRFTWTTEKTSIPEIRKLGYIFGKRNEAEELIEFYGKVLNSIEEKVECISEEDMPKVYFEWDRYKTAGIYYNIGLSGGKDIFADCEAPEIDPEAVIERDPEIIINMVWMPGITWGYDVDDTADLEETREEVMNRPELQNVTAVKDGNVYIITGHLTFGPYCGSRDFIRIAYFAKWFHPDLFEDLDPKAIHQEYLTRFHGLDIDLDEKGVFVYPPLE